MDGDAADKEKMLEKVQRMQGHVEKYKGLKSKDEVVNAVKERIRQKKMKKIREE